MASSAHQTDKSVVLHNRYNRGCWLGIASGLQFWICCNPSPEAIKSKRESVHSRISCTWEITHLACLPMQRLTTSKCDKQALCVLSLPTAEGWAEHLVWFKQKGVRIWFRTRPVVRSFIRNVFRESVEARRGRRTWLWNTGEVQPRLEGIEYPCVSGELISTEATRNCKNVR